MKKLLLVIGIILLAVGVISLLLAAWHWYSYYHVMDGSADRVQQSGAAADLILLIRHRLDLFQRDPVIKDPAAVGKQDCGDQNRSFPLLLLFQHGVEAADGIALKTCHGAAAIQDEYEFCQIAVHNRIPLSFTLALSYR